MDEIINFALFDGKGKFRRDISEQDRAGLSPDKLALLNAVESAADNLANTEVLLKNSEDARKSAHDALQEASRHLATLQPTSVAELEQRERRTATLSVAERVRLARLPIAPEIQTALADIVAAEDTFAGSKTTCHELQLALSAARGVVAKAVVAWQQSFTVISHDQLLRDHVRSEHQKRMGGSEMAAPQEPVILAPIDAYMRGSKGPLGINSARQANRPPAGADRVYPAAMRGMTVLPPAQKPWAVEPLGSHRS